MRSALIALATFSVAACAQTPAMPASLIDGVAYAPVGFARNVDAVFLLGSQNTPGLYTIRVHIKPDGLMPPHTHPDARMVTVLAGDLYYGFTNAFDPAAAKHYPVGATFLVPANTPHFGWAKSGDVIYQEAGMAPTATTPIAK